MSHLDSIDFSLDGYSSDDIPKKRRHNDGDDSGDDNFYNQFINDLKKWNESGAGTKGAAAMAHDIAPGNNYNIDALFGGDGGGGETPFNLDDSEDDEEVRND